MNINEYRLVWNSLIGCKSLSYILTFYFKHPYNTLFLSTRSSKSEKNDNK